MTIREKLLAGFMFPFLAVGLSGLLFTHGRQTYKEMLARALSEGLLGK